MISKPKLRLGSPDAYCHVRVQNAGPSLPAQTARNVRLDQFFTHPDIAELCFG